MKIDQALGDRKAELHSYFRNRAAEIIGELQNEYGKKQYKKITQALQPAVRDSRDSLIRAVTQKAQKEEWFAKSILRAVLLIHHVTNATMLEYRHLIWPYEYMAFSRRIGELWESFVGTCFHFPVATNLSLEIPPLFSDVRNKLGQDIDAYIDSLPLNNEQKVELKEYYRKVWLLVDAGEIKLELDMHFLRGTEHFNVDFKSGFSSNEKGNTNRLLVVASIYRNIISSDYRNLLLVRSPEEDNNHYLQTLKNSGLWEVSCGEETYATIGDLVGFNLRQWIEQNINWEEDLGADMFAELAKADLTRYLKW
jgi:hypothetical protein